MPLQLNLLHEEILEQRQRKRDPLKLSIYAGIGLAALLLSANALQPLKIDFSDETVGAEPKSFLSVVGVWRIETDGNKKVLVVDGRHWRRARRRR